MNIFQTSAIAICTAAASFAAPVHAQQWQGAWNSTFGQLRLVQDGDHVFGDYRDGTIEGIIDQSTGRVRAIFRNPDGSTGYAEFMLVRDGSFSGAFDWANQPMPRHNAGPADRKWTGSRTAASVPPITRFKLPGNRTAFLNTAPAAYRTWVNGFATSGTATAPTAPSPAPTATATPAPPPTASVNPLTAKIPKLEDYPANFVPKTIEVNLDQLEFWYGGLRSLRPDSLYQADIYGTYGIYAYCETPSGRRSLTPQSGQPNRIFDRTRAQSVGIGGPSNVAVQPNQSRRRFTFDSACLDTAGGRIAVQVQSNLNERNAIETRDTKFGYRSQVFYLDQLPPRRLGTLLMDSSSQRLRLGTNLSDTTESRVYTAVNQDNRWVAIVGTVRFLP
jgi:hypothetical protein